MKKRFLCLFLAVLMLLSVALVGCEKKDDTEADIDTNTGAKTITMRIITEQKVFNTDEVAFGGSGVTNAGVQFRSEQFGGKHAVRLRLPPLGVTVLRCTRKKATRKKSRA